MADLLQTGSAWLRSQRRAHISHTVTYARGALSARVQATVGQTSFQVDSGYGLFQEVTSRDFIIDVDDLAAFGEPQRGDRVTETLNGSNEVFEILAPGTEPHFEYSDRDRAVFRIHTKHVESG